MTGTEPGGARPRWTGQVLELTVEGPAHGGEFVARHRGRVVFVRGTAPGELVRAEVTADPGKGFCRARVQTVLRAAPARIVQPCPAAAAGAGCCDWGHLDPGVARELKGRVLAEQLRRVGGLGKRAPEHVPVSPLGGGGVRGWRTVQRLRADTSGVPGPLAAGTDRVVPLPCAQVDPALDDALRERRWPAGHEVLGVRDDDGDVHLAHRPIPTGRGAGRGGGRGAATSRRARRSAPAPWVLVAGSGVVVRRAAGLRWVLGTDCFWQAHRLAAEHYAGLVARASAGLPAEARVWDLYGGAGVLAAGVRTELARARVTVVESNPASAVDLRSAFGDDARLTTVTAPVHRFLAGTGPGSAGGTGTAGEHGGGPDLVVLDPPRVGAGREVMVALADCGARRIVHVGCDAAAFARDVGELVARGWEATELVGVDAFPGTHHVEAVAVLDRPVDPRGRRSATPEGVVQW